LKKKAISGSKQKDSLNQINSKKPKKSSPDSSATTNPMPLPFAKEQMSISKMANTYKPYMISKEPCY